MSADVLALEILYAYGYSGREMIAVRSPFAMAADAAEIIGRRICVDGEQFLVIGVLRQIHGPIALGEPIGLEIQPVQPEIEAEQPKSSANSRSI